MRLQLTFADHRRLRAVLRFLLMSCLLLVAGVASAAQLRMAMLPILRGPGVEAALARQVQDELVAALVDHSEVLAVSTQALDAGARSSRVAKALSGLAEGAPVGALAVQLEAIGTQANLDRLLLARVDVSGSGRRLLLVAVLTDGSKAVEVAELSWRGPLSGAPSGLAAAVSKWVAPKVAGRGLVASRWPAGAVADGADAAGAAGASDGPAADETTTFTAAEPQAGPEAEPPTPVGVTAEARTNYYSDNDGNRIVTPTVTVAGGVAEHVSMAAHVAVDMMTCASVDVISAATAKGYFQETRQEYGGSVTIDRKLAKVTVGATRSMENDYSSATGSIAISDEFAKRNTTLSLAYSFTGSNVGRAHDPNFSRRLDSHAVTVSWVQVLGRNWVGQLSGFVGVLSGFQSSVYRFVHFTDGTAGPESAPDFRMRQALAAELRGSLSSSWFTGASYRLYTDNWGLLSHTGEATLTWAPLDLLSIRVRDRVYWQQGASFYHSVYSERLRYMTIDRELGAMQANLVGVKLAIDLGSTGSTTSWELDLKYDWMWQHFDDFPWLKVRTMSMVEAGLQCAF